MVFEVLFKGRSDRDQFSTQRRKERKGRKVDENAISRHVVDAALAIHKELGPGLLESAYVAALEIEFSERGLSFIREAIVQGTYHRKPLGVSYRVDLLVEKLVVLEVKAVQALDSVHGAQLLSYLRLGKWKLGMLLNFHAPLMKNGIRRIVNDL
jgi:GxxExxY protein